MTELRLFLLPMIFQFCILNSAFFILHFLVPELPEVQTVVSDLAEVLPGKTIQSTEILWQKTVATSAPAVFRQQLQGNTVKAVWRRAKCIVIEFTNASLLLFHLRMSGQLFWKAAEGAIDARHLRVHIRFTDTSQLLFNDMRKFGRTYFFQNIAVCEEELFYKLGPEPLEINTEEFIQRFHSKTGGIKANLLRQDIICGLGNIYADESLFASGIHPQSQTNKIPIEKLKKLHAEIQNVLTAAINLRGTSMRDYLDITGNAGLYKEILNVYQQDGEPCVNCGNKIAKIRVAGRGTHICRHCQVKY